MNTLKIILQALFFVVNTFAVCLIVWGVGRAAKRMEQKLDDTIRFMRWVKARHDATHLEMLYRILSLCIRQEEYEDAAKIKKIIDEELKDLKKE